MVRPGFTNVRLTGELDLASVPAMSEALARPHEGFSRLVVVDMRTVTFLDLSAARILLQTSTAVASEGCRMTIVRGAIAFDWWLRLLRLDEQLEIIGTGRERGG